MENQSKMLEKNGFCVYKNALNQVDLKSIKNISLQAITNLSSNHRKRNKSQGSLILIAERKIYNCIIRAYISATTRVTTPGVHSSYSHEDLEDLPELGDAFRMILKASEKNI